MNYVTHVVVGVVYTYPYVCNQVYVYVCKCHCILCCVYSCIDVCGLYVCTYEMDFPSTQWHREKIRILQVFQIGSPCSWGWFVVGLFGKSITKAVEMLYSTTNHSCVSCSEFGTGGFQVSCCRAPLSW